MTSASTQPGNETGAMEGQEKMKNVLFAASGLLSLCENSTGSATEQHQPAIPSPQSAPLEDHTVERQAGGSAASSFPEKLMEILSADGLGSTIAWLPHGRSFAIVNPKAFTAKVLPKYFKKTKFTSFTRKLSRWGFERRTNGSEAGAYYHKLFQRDNKKLCLRMRCGQVKKPISQTAIVNRLAPKQVRFGHVEVKTLPAEECNSYRKTPKQPLTISSYDLARKFDKMAIRIANYKRSIPTMPIHPQHMKCTSLIPHSPTELYSPEASSAIISAALAVLDRSASLPTMKHSLIPSSTAMHQQAYSVFRGKQNTVSVKRASAA